MQDEELYRYEYEAPAKERVQAEYKIQDANAQFAAKRTVTLGVICKHRPRTPHRVDRDRRCGRGHEHGAAALFCSAAAVGTEYPAEAMGALCRYLFEMARVNACSPFA